MLRAVAHPSAVGRAEHMLEGMLSLRRPPPRAAGAAAGAPALSRGHALQLVGSRRQLLRCVAAARVTERSNGVATCRGQCHLFPLHLRQDTLVKLMET